MIKEICLSLLFVSIGLSAHLSSSAAQETGAPGVRTTQHSFTLIIDGEDRDVSFTETERGEALYQGDIILHNDALELARASAGPDFSLQSALKNFGLFGLVARDKSRVWPLGKVRFAISSNAPNQQEIYRAIAHWEALTPLQFIDVEEPTNENNKTKNDDIVIFRRSTGCSSKVGREGGVQFINLSSRCTYGNIVHEIGHAVGLMHEQARSDRDRFITVLTANIQPHRVGNFEIDAFRFKDTNQYCYNSIMHYGDDFFQKRTGLKTILVNVPPGTPSTEIGQRDGLADCDVETVNALYAEEFKKRDAS